jgi:hypothetical protein
MSSAQKRSRRKPLDHQATQRSDDANAFIPDPEGGPAIIDDDLAQSMAEEFVENATTGQGIEKEALDADVSEEIGGPFVETSAAEELSFGADASNPPETIPEPVPRAVAGLVTAPAIEEPGDGNQGADAEGADQDPDADIEANDPDLRARAPEQERDLDALNTKDGARRRSRQ